MGKKGGNLAAAVAMLTKSADADDDESVIMEVAPPSGKRAAEGERVGDRRAAPKPKVAPAPTPPGPKPKAAPLPKAIMPPSPMAKSAPAPPVVAPAPKPKAKAKSRAKQVKTDALTAPTFEVSWENISLVQEHFGLTEQEAVECLLQVVGPSKAGERFWSKYKTTKKPPVPEPNVKKSEAAEADAAEADLADIDRQIDEDFDELFSATEADEEDLDGEVLEPAEIDCEETQPMAVDGAFADTQVDTLAAGGAPPEPTHEVEAWCFNMVELIKNLLF